MEELGARAVGSVGVGQHASAAERRGAQKQRGRAIAEQDPGLSVGLVEILRRGIRRHQEHRPRGAREQIGERRQDAENSA